MWVSHLDGTLARIDLGTKKVTENIPVTTRADGVAVSGGSVWVADSFAGKVFSVDPDRGRVTGHVSLPNGADRIVAGGGSVWVLDSGTGTVDKIDTTTGKVANVIRVGTADSSS